MTETQTIAAGAAPTASGLHKTDYTRWRLKTEDGRQIWHYLSEEEAVSWPQTIADKYHLGLPTVCFLPQNTPRHPSLAKARSKRYIISRASPIFPPPEHL